MVICRTVSIYISKFSLQALAVTLLSTLEDVGVRGMKHEITMGNICSSNNNNKVADLELTQNMI